MSEIIIDSVIDSIKLLPFLFLTYLFMEWLEHKTGSAARNRIRTAGKLGPVWGGLLGVIPQCGFSAAASSLFTGRVITVGTLIAVYLSTSDEMFPIMISNAVPAVTIIRILACKAAIGIISGLIVEYVYTHILKKQEGDLDIHEICEEERCNCEHGLISSAATHTLKVFVYIFLISLVLNIIIGLVGEETLAGLFTGAPVIGELIAALVGLIPNCASSVVITQLYLDHIIGAGAMMAGLLVNAGVGLLILFRLNHDRVQNLKIIGTLYGLGVFWGIIIELSGIVF
nr:putative manganese transporter [uncultured Blautia sp.]